jgi:hypothetical protein
MPTIAANVCGASRNVCTAKTTRTKAVATMATMITHIFDPVSCRRRRAASEMIRKMPRATTLPSDAIAVRSTRLASRSTRPTEISNPRVPPTRANCPKTD